MSPLTSSLVVGAALLSAVHAAEPALPLLLWPDGAPGALGTRDEDKPSITPYLPSAERAPTSAIVICPGGGYGGLAPHEGADYAQFLAREGIACFVLKYRLGSHGYRHPVMLGDVQRAIRLVRSKALEWKLDPEKIGVMGSSAGGHLASTAVTHFDDGQSQAADPIDRVSSRPSFGILCYPVLSMMEFTHAGSRKNLLGDAPSPELLWKLSSELQVTPRTPPCFVWHTQEDAAVPVEGSMAFAAALRRARVPFELHVFDKGRHGIGLQARPPAFENPHPWAGDLLHWMRQQGWVK